MKIEDEPRGGCLPYLIVAMLCAWAAQCNAALREAL